MCRYFVEVGFHLIKSQKYNLFLQGDGCICFVTCYKAVRLCEDIEAAQQS